MRAAHRLRSAAPPRRPLVLSRTLPRAQARRRPSPPRSPATPARQDRVATDKAGSAAGSGTPRDLRHARSRLAGRRHQRPLLIGRPNPAPLRARNNRDLTHRTIANPGANTVACTSATSADHPFSARRSTPEGYLDSECDVVLPVRPEDSDVVAAMATELRDGLLAEHLGCDVANVREAIVRLGGLIAAIE